MGRGRGEPQQTASSVGSTTGRHSQKRERTHEQTGILHWRKRLLARMPIMDHFMPLLSHFLFRLRLVYSADAIFSHALVSRILMVTSSSFMPPPQHSSLFVKSGSMTPPWKESALMSSELANLIFCEGVLVKPSARSPNCATHSATMWFKG